MTDHLPYDFATIGRESFGDRDEFIVQAERWRDVNGHHVHTVVAVDHDDESVTLMIPDAATARRLKNLFARVERSL
jgi:hypothetical protein